MSALSLILVTALGAAGGSGVAAWEDLCGPADVAYVTGNGGLTVGFNPGGRITSCRWPSPGYSDQILYRAVSRALPAWGVAPWQGAMFAVRAASSVYWLNGATPRLSQEYAPGAAPIIQTAGALYDNGPAFVQRAFVHPQDDLLVIRFELRGVTTPPHFYWFQNFNPCTRRIPEWPVADWLLDELNDFAAFCTPDNATLYHFRPAGPGAQDWQKAEDFAAQYAAPAAWETFEKGVWIGAASPNRVTGAQCGLDGAPDAPWAAIEAGVLRGPRAAVGQCQSAFELEPEPIPESPGAYAATVYVAFGETRAGVDALLGRARQEGEAALMAETQSYWREWFRKTGLTAESERMETLRVPLLTLAVSTDRTSGAVVRAAVTQPPLAVTSAQQAALVVLAFDRAGLPEQAEKLVRFYAKAIRPQSRPSMPAGSLPLALFADGSPASPHFVLAVDASAWWVSMAWRHAGFLEPSARSGFLQSLWNDVVRAADFLGDWTVPGTGEPLPSFHLDRLRDVRSTDLLLKMFMGFECALHIAHELELPIDEEWQARRRELDALLRFRIRDQQTPWPMDEVFPAWLKNIVGESHPVWTARVICGGRIDAMQAFAFPDAEPSNAPPFPDTYRAALKIIALTPVNGDDAP